MGKLVDLSGRTFGLLTVLQRVEDRKPGRPCGFVNASVGIPSLYRLLIYSKKMEQSHVGAYDTSNLPPSLI